MEGTSEHRCRIRTRIRRRAGVFRRAAVGIASAVVGVGLAATLVPGASAQTDGSGTDSAPPCEKTRATEVPQATAAQLKAAGYDKLPLAALADRVDLVAPPFSDPTHITNPLFPISKLHSAVLNGRVDGKPFKTETTLLPATRIVEWTDGQCV